LRKVTVWLYSKQYEDLSKQPDACWGISTLVRRAVDEYLKRQEHPTKPESNPTLTTEENGNRNTAATHPTNGE